MITLCIFCVLCLQFFSNNFAKFFRLLCHLIKFDIIKILTGVLFVGNFLAIFYNYSGGGTILACVLCNVFDVF